MSGGKLKVILFGATGMVGQGVLRECLLDPDVERVLAVGRSATGQRNAKLEELRHDNFLDFAAVDFVLRDFALFDIALSVALRMIGLLSFTRPPTLFPLKRSVTRRRRWIIRLKVGLDFSLSILQSCRTSGTLPGALLNLMHLRVAR